MTAGAGDAPIVHDGSTPFERDTAVESLGGGRYRAAISPAWWIVMGPNGGYVAAILLRAVVTEVADPSRRPISATFHYLRPPTEGDVEVDVRIERSGRSVSNVSARMTQDGRLLVLALVALGTPREGSLEFDETDGLPRALDGSAVPRWSDIEPAPIDPERDIPMRARYEMRWGFGGVPFGGEPGATAETGSRRSWTRWCSSPCPMRGCRRCSAGPRCSWRCRPSI